MSTDMVHSEDLSNEDLAYAAGIIDGEGCVGLGRSVDKAGRAYFYTRVTVVNTDARLINWMFSKFGGSVYNHSNGKNHRHMFKWGLWGTDAVVSFLRLIRPHLKLKQSQADVIFSYQEVKRASGARRGRGGVEHTEKFLERASIMAEAMSILNERGIKE